MPDAEVLGQNKKQKIASSILVTYTHARSLIKRNCPGSQTYQQLRPNRGQNSQCSRRPIDESMD